MDTTDGPIDYAAEVQLIRNTYITAYPKLRLHIITERLKADTGDQYDPARFVTAVSAVEAFARCLLIGQLAKTKAQRGEVYNKVKDIAPDVLVQRVLLHHGHDNPKEHFAAGAWALFRHAINYRNLIIHECTFVGQDKYPAMIEATLEVFRSLVALTGMAMPGEEEGDA